MSVHTILFHSGTLDVLVIPLKRATLRTLKSMISLLATNACWNKFESNDVTNSSDEESR
jgi:hypothetical protein